MGQSLSQRAIRIPTRSERVADGVVHALGVSLALVGTVLLIVFAALVAPAPAVAAVSVYTGLMLFGLVASAFYHLSPWPRLKPWLRRIDHAAIYLKIAGTYTPIVVLIGSGFAYAVLVGVWLLALAGAVMKLGFWNAPGRLDPLFYLALGWASLLLVWPVIATLPVSASVLILIGGLTYSAGVFVFANWHRLRFAGAMWHGMVLGASACFFSAITVAVFSAPV
jgi:hemolysin III